MSATSSIDFGGRIRSSSHPGASPKTDGPPAESLGKMAAESADSLSRQASIAPEGPRRAASASHTDFRVPTSFASRPWQEYPAARCPRRGPSFALLARTRQVLTTTHGIPYESLVATLGQAPIPPAEQQGEWLAICKLRFVGGNRRPLRYLYLGSLPLFDLADPPAFVVPTTMPPEPAAGYRSARRRSGAARSSTMGRPLRQEPRALEIAKRGITWVRPSRYCPSSCISLRHEKNTGLVCPESSIVFVLFLPG